MGNQQSSNLPVYYNADPTNEATFHALSKYIDLASSQLGSKIVATSDEFFAPAKNLLKPTAPIKDSERTTDHGAWYDGWETRRHNPKHDWVIIKLAFPGIIAGFDIDTAHFTGNHAPVASVDACFVDDTTAKSPDYQWEELLPKVELGPSSRHLLALWNPPTTPVNYVRLNIYPDGGVARFRVYGTVKPNWSQQASASQLDLASVGNGGRAVACSNQYFSTMSNLLLPGRGATMKDGWETKRSRKPNHSDWVTVKLGATGYLDQAEIDTYQFKGNYPQAASLQACYSLLDNPDEDTDCFWFQVLSKSPLEAHQLHYFNLDLADQPFTHVRLNIYPDGGIKRLRIRGRRCTEEEIKNRKAAPTGASNAMAVESSVSAVKEATIESTTMVETITTASISSRASTPMATVLVNGQAAVKNARVRDDDDADALRAESSAMTATPKRSRKTKSRQPSVSKGAAL
ncbi:Allantoicase [Dimargaris verticillata]|uniref:Allantoicase n=1 Tax=Dimargaris verticillata TaxID=2761393 RepID=A0A9W8AY52_9FUNG|nr:Allantoicase [Dimargaris verticillata]